MQQAMKFNNENIILLKLQLADLIVTKTIVVDVNIYLCHSLRTKQKIETFRLTKKLNVC